MLKYYKVDEVKPVCGGKPRWTQGLH